MRHRKHTTKMSNWIDLVKHTHPKTGRIHYTIEVKFYPNSQNFKVDDRFSIRRHFGPNDNRPNNSSWKFRNRKIAEQLILLAILKWGD